MKTTKLKTRGLSQTRLELGLTQAELADKLGISRSHLSMAEAGQRGLSASALIKLAGLSAMAKDPVLVAELKEPMETAQMRLINQVHQKMANCNLAEFRARIQLSKMMDDFHRLKVREKIAPGPHPGLFKKNCEDLGPIPQEILSFKISALKTESKFYEDLLVRIKNG